MKIPARASTTCLKLFVLTLRCFLAGGQSASQTKDEFTNSYLNAYFVARPDVAVLADRQQATRARASHDV